MTIYLIIFAIVTILTIFAKKTYKRNKHISYLFSIICILILSVFAGIRDTSVGIDLHYYGTYMFNRAANYHNLFDYLETFHKSDILYYSLNFLVTRFTKDIHIFLFIHQLIISTIVYIIAYREKEKSNMWLVILCYLTLWYNSSFNILRQSISIFILLYGFKYLEEKKYIKYVLLVLLASGFHQSTLIYIIMPLMGKICSKKENIIKTIILSTSLLISFLFIDKIFEFVSTYFPSFLNYSSYVVIKATNLKKGYLIFKIGMLIEILFFYFFTSNKKQNQLLMTMSIFDVIFYSLSGFMRYGYRLSYLFLIHNIIFLPRMEKNIKIKNNKIIYLITIIMFLLLYWYFRYVAAGYDGTIPYKIGVLGV